MSEATRVALAEAASSVEGVTCNPWYWQSAKTGSAMVRLERINYPNAFGGITTWQVWVMTPSHLANAEKFIDTIVPPLVQALGTQMTVTTVTPQMFVFDAAQVPGISIEGTRETESN